MLDAANTRPSRTPSTMAPMLNSFGASVGGTYGRKTVVVSVVCGGMVMREYGAECQKVGRSEEWRSDGRWTTGSRPQSMDHEPSDHPTFPPSHHPTLRLSCPSPLPLR